LYRKIYTILYIHTHIRQCKKRSVLIARAVKPADEADHTGMYENDSGTMPAYDEYVSSEMEKPEYRRIRIGLDRLERIIVKIMAGQGCISRGQSLSELDEVLRKLQEIEVLAENVRDIIMWEHILDRIDLVIAVRRHLVAEIRWEIQSERKCQESALSA
jgi:hypothetical protein